MSWLRPSVHRGVLGAALLATLALGCGAEPVADPAAPGADSTAPAELSARERLPDSYFEEDSGRASEPPALPKGQEAAYLPVSDASATEWQIRRAGNSYPMAVYATIGYGLFDDYNDRFLRYEVRDYGINLGWTTSNLSNIAFERPGGGSAALRYGEPLSLRVVGQSYVRYGRRTWGINLVWSDTPVYDWEIRGGTTGQPVYSQQPIRLHNRTTGAAVVYCPRPWGINLAWQSDCTEVGGTRLKTSGYW